MVISRYVFAARQCQRGHYVLVLSVCHVSPFVQIDIVSTISHKRLEQSRWNLQGIFTSPSWWPD